MRLGPSRPSPDADGRPGRSRAWPPVALVPALAVVVAALTVWPVCALLWTVVRRSGWVRAELWPAFGNSLIVAALATALAAMIAVPIAWLVERSDVPCASLIRRTMLATLFVPSIGFAIGWQAVPVQMPPLLAMVCVLAAAALAPFYLAIASMLARADPAADEAARFAGATTVDRITAAAENLSPAIGAAAALVFARAISDLGAPLVLTAPIGLPLLPTEALRVFELDPAGPTAAAIALVLCLVTALSLSVAGHMGRRATAEIAGGGDAGSAAAIHLGIWRWPLAALALGIVFCVVGVPLGALLWSARAHLNLEALIAPVWTTLTVAAVTAALALLVVTPTVALAHRPQSLGASFTATLCLLPAAVPGLALAIGVAAAHRGLAGGSAVLIVMALLALALPGALHHLRDGMAAIPPDELDAARMLGADRRMAWFRIMLPQLTPRLIGVWALVFAACCREVPASLLLSANGARPLAAQSAVEMRAGHLEFAAALVVAAMAVSAVVVALAQRASGAPLLMVRR